MDVIETALEDVKILAPKRFGDPRGFFAETYNATAFAKAGLELAFMQDNLSLSRARYTIRGLHAQKPPSAQTKLVSCLAGAILDVAIDVRQGSPTFGRHVAVELSFDNGRQLLVPKGFLHGFCTLTEDCLVTYKVDAGYDKAADCAIAFDDPDLAIAWPVGRDQAQLSDKDAAAPRLRDLAPLFTYAGARP